MSSSVALLGGVYSNHYALAEALRDVDARGVTSVYCLGDLGAFGPNPDKVIELLRDAGVGTVQGNYDNSIGNGLDDCQCGYTDPRDNYFAKLSYDYTFRKTSVHHREWLKALPGEIRFEWHGKRVLLCHGSPRQINEFLWESTTPTHFLEKLCDDFEADIICGTHTGLHWYRQLSNDRYFINVGALGRPANDGTARVWYALLSADEPRVEFVPVHYDHQALAKEMRDEGLPEEFVQTVHEGWWTTCLEVLPAKERARGRY
ncbi:MAG: metallophosphoesterase [Chromatiales bacterium]|jgi:diadenosine tetraphosphatase ApaH/serine/threonine PP2A family protein phosphatase|nr:metallophosphoesterase [Chromatiales bacterium]